MVEEEWEKIISSSCDKFDLVRIFSTQSKYTTTCSQACERHKPGMEDIIVEITTGVLIGLHTDSDPTGPHQFVRIP
jgi:hypothetical protein